MSKFTCVLINNDNDFKDLMEQNDKFSIERGLKASLNTDIQKELVSMFSKLSSKGYHVTGFILDDEKGIEFLFQRDKNQKQKLKEIEVKNKYVM
jgi:hypothetical protein